MLSRACLVCVVLFLALAGPAVAQGGTQKPTFAAFLADVRAEALAQGVSEATLDAAFAGLTAPAPEVLRRDVAQPESRITFAQYKRRVVSQDRIERGRALYRRHRALLAQIEADTGVAGHYLVALWGVESDFGANTGSFRVIPALATLAYDGRRAAFFRRELLAALHVLDAGHVAPARMTGSWAGAMGQVQFMPTSFQRFAADGDGDARADIWDSAPDALASAARYLAQSSWRSGERWGRRVVLPPGFDEALLGRDAKRPLAQWQAMGVRLPGGGGLPRSDMPGGIVVPGDGQAFLVYANYDVLMGWNRSLYFATSVGLLADAIAAAAP
jgi:membrane-bound lytic murein transglycosylase B